MAALFPKVGQSVDYYIESRTPRVARVVKVHGGTGPPENVDLWVWLEFDDSGLYPEKVASAGYDTGYAQAKGKWVERVVARSIFYPVSHRPLIRTVSGGALAPADVSVNYSATQNSATAGVYNAAANFRGWLFTFVVPQDFVAEHAASLIVRCIGKAAYGAGADTMVCGLYARAVKESEHLSTGGTTFSNTANYTVPTSIAAEDEINIPYTDFFGAGTLEIGDRITGVFERNGASGSDTYGDTNFYGIEFRYSAVELGVT